MEKSFITVIRTTSLLDMHNCNTRLSCELEVFIEMSISNEELHKFKLFTPSLLMPKSTQMSQWQGFEYLYRDGFMSWEKAEEECQHWTGHLLSLHSQQEVNHILNHLPHSLFVYAVYVGMPDFEVKFHISPNTCILCEISKLLVT